jgi:hypothetical protein
VTESASQGDPTGMPAPPGVRRELDLEPWAFSYVPARRAAPPLPPAEPFNLEACLARLREGSRTPPARTLDPQEAEFWLMVMTSYEVLEDQIKTLRRRQWVIAA